MMGNKGARPVVAVIAVIALIVIAYATSGGSDKQTASTAAPTMKTTHSYAAPTPIPTIDVRYYVQVAPGTHINVTYHNAEGGTEQVDYTGSWDKVISVPRGFSASLVAQLDNTYATTIACEIQVNGKTIKRSESNAKYGLVTCAGRVD